MFYALMIGIVAGLRALTPLAAVSWAARLGLLHLNDSWLAFLGYRWTPWILTLLALAEIVNDKLPQTPSRRSPPQFGTRVITGIIAGLSLGISIGSGLGYAISGAIGACVGTLSGSAVRSKLVRLIGGRDLPIALLEDGIAIASAAFIVDLFA